MKASELIKKLQEILDKEGDLELIDSLTCDSLVDVYIDKQLKIPVIVLDF